MINEPSDNEIFDVILNAVALMEGEYYTLDELKHAHDPSWEEEVLSEIRALLSKGISLRTAVKTVIGA